MMGHVNNVDVGVGISHRTSAIVKSDSLFQPNLSPKTCCPGVVCCCFATHYSRLHPSQIVTALRVPLLREQDFTVPR